MKKKYPVGNPTTIEIYRNDVKVRHFAGSNRGKAVGGKRGKITGWSSKSRKKLAFIAANTHIDFTYMVTLTYPKCFPGNGREVKRHLDRFLVWCGRQMSEFTYLWFLEFQKRGAPHYHVLWHGEKIDKWDISNKWYSIVGSGDENHRRYGTRVETLRSTDGGRRYAVKYASKMQQKTAPKGYEHVGRFFGYSRNVKPEPLARRRVGGVAHLNDILKDWKHLDKDESWKYSTLYGAAEVVTLRDDEII